MADLRARLLRMSEAVPSGCREWRAARNPKGYGKITVGSAKDGSRCIRGAHRVAYEVFVGPIPSTLYVLHACDNPGCIEPRHLFVGTALDNARDRDAKGRKGFAPGEANGQATLTDRQVMSIRWLVAEGLKQRAVAAMFGVGVGLVQKVAAGDRWSHLPVLPYSPQRGGSLRRVA